LPRLCEYAPDLVNNFFVNSKLIPADPLNQTSLFLPANYPYALPVGQEVYTSVEMWKGTEFVTMADKLPTSKSNDGFKGRSASSAPDFMGTRSTHSRDTSNTDVEKTVLPVKKQVLRKGVSSFGGPPGHRESEFRRQSTLTSAR